MPIAVSATGPESSQLRVIHSVRRVGVLDQGAPVCALWKSAVGTHGRYSSAGIPKAIAAARSSDRRSPRRAASSTASAIASARARKTNQSCV